MAHFRGTLSSMRGKTVTRLGGANTGVEVSADGWDFGVHVTIDCLDGVDTASVFLTTGSASNTKSQLLGTYTRADLDRLLAKKKGGK